MTAYYNENDPYCAQWLRNLIDKNLIALGEVDARDIRDVRPADLKGFTQCHFFAGIGGWSHALRLAAWPDHRQVWTGSCPCQPFSAAGKSGGFADQRHLWPYWFHLIAQCKPDVVFGEQVAAAIRWGWLDLVLSDLEGEGYAVGSAVLPACGVGAPHIRQRLWFVAESDRQRCQGQGVHILARQSRQAISGVDGTGNASELAGKVLVGRKVEERSAHSEPLPKKCCYPLCATSDGLLCDTCPDGELADDPSARLEGAAGAGIQERSSRLAASSIMGHSDISRSQGRRIDAGEHADQRSPWEASKLSWLSCTDGKARPTQSGLFPLAHGISGRVGRLRAYGNAIVPQVAAEFIAACL